MDSRRSLAAIVVVAIAASLPVARAEEVSPPFVWYRSGEGCPDGTGFLQKLEARGVHARLAVVGDPIDFVVTLGSGADGARGLLERQTKTGTVAIRRLDGGTCDEIAEGLALSLSLADAPEERRREEPAAPAPAPESHAAPRIPEHDAGAGAPGFSSPKPSRPRLAIGAHGDAVSGISPELMPGASIFFDVAPGSGVLSRSSFRAGAFAYTGGSSTDDRDYHLWLAGGRLEACPTWLGGAAVRIHPCVSVDLGTLQTSGSGPSARTAGAFWAAAGFGLRLDVPASERFGFEAEVAAQFPFTRYDIVAGVPEKPLYRTAAVGVGAGLGAYFVLP